MKYLVAAIFLLLDFSASAQQLNFTRFSYAEGLNTYNIQKTVQDKYGFVWVATQDGLYRFDGIRFEAFRKSGHAAGSLRENFVFDLSYPGGDELFLATFKGGIERVNVRTLEVSPGAPRDSAGLPNLWISKLACDQLGNIWIGGRNYLAVYQKQTARFIFKTEVVDQGVSREISFIKPIDSILIAVGIADKGVLLYDVRTLKLVALVDQLGPAVKVPEYAVSDLLMHKGSAFIATNTTLVKGHFTHNQWIFEEHIPLPALSGGVIICMASDGHETIWLGTNSGLACYNTTTRKFTLFPADIYKKRWLEDNTINHLMIDQQNNLWISTLKALQMVSLKPNPFQSYTGDRPSSDRMDHLYALVAKSPTEVFAMGTDGFYEVDLISEAVKKVKGSGSLGINHYITPVGPDLWLLSTDKGMYAYKPAEGLLSQELVVRLFPEWAPFLKRYFNMSLTFDGRVYWASEEQEGLLIWDTARHEIRQYKAETARSKGMPENHIHNLKPDRNGDIWLLFDESVGKYSIKQDSITEVIRYSGGKTGLNSRIIFDMHDDGEKLWFGTFNGGLNGYDRKTRKWTYITEREGLSNDCVYSIQPESDSIFWVSTNMGLSRVAFKKKHCTNYYFEDGLQDNSFDEMSNFRIGSKLFFGGINGFTSVDLDAYKPDRVKAPVYIKRVEYLYKDKRVVLNDLKWEKLILPTGTHTITVQLSALNYTGNHKIKFSYRLKGLQKQYLDVANDNRIVLNAIPFGDYELQIRYLNENGAFVTDGLKLRFYIRPAWYQTWWFKILLVLAAFGIAYAYYRMRLGQIMKQHKIRVDVASDLHDDIGSSLNSVKVFAHLAGSDPSKKEYIHNIEENLEQATTGLRDMIWILDDNLDTVDDLRNRLSQLSARPAEAIGISVNFTMADGLQRRTLSKPVKRNLFLIAKEAINNSVKYARCRSINVSFALVSKKFVVTVRDDGQGFDVATIGHGYGMDNMRHRADQIHFDFDIRSDASGTEIRVGER